MNAYSREHPELSDHSHEGILNDLLRAEDFEGLRAAFGNDEESEVNDY